MSTGTRRFAIGLVVFVACFAVAWAASGEKVKPVDAKYVCMINKKEFKTAQESVEINGHTYYYCCAMCRTQLQEDAKTRVDKDPVSGKEVDKATASIGVDKAGNVYFFENVENLQKFRVPAKAQ